MLRPAAAFLVVFLSGTAAQACYEQASRAHGVDPALLMAIGYIESRWQADAINVNANGSEDLCEMQINDQHLPALEPFGITRTVLLTDRCTCIAVGAWILADALRIERGRVWDAVATYHTGPTGDPERRAWYAGNVQRVYAALLNLP